MKLPVLTAVGGAGWEAGLVQALERSPSGVTVVRRCVDVADLLATAATGTARAVLVSSDLRRLDRDAVGRLAASGVAVVGLVAGGDDDAVRRLRRLGVTHVLDAASDAAEISAAVTDAVAHPVPPPVGGPFDTRSALADLDRTPVGDGAPPVAIAAGTGRVIAVWGPTGAPGRTTVAVTLASELATLGYETALVDADVYGGSVGQALGLLDEAPGLAAAVRLANNGSLDHGSLAGVARSVSPRLRVLSGITRADRWPELRPAAVSDVLELLRETAAYVVVDCGFCLEQDEELAFDHSAARRNGATLAALAAADTVLAVGGIDSVSLQRLVRGLAELADAVPDADVTVVLNRVRGGVVPGDVAAEVGAALRRYAGVEAAAFIPADQRAADHAMAIGRSLTEMAPKSPARLALRDLAVALSGARTRGRRSLLRR